MPFKGGDTFAGYTIQRMLGSGGMGEVYLARHPRLPRPDALKILSVDATRDEEFRARFVREAELAATLWHPHIVGVHDRGEFNGRLWISMDYVDGTDARRLLAEHYQSGMPEQDVLEIVTAVAEALDFAHERRLLHRDVKPANILVTTPSPGSRRRVLLTDFGIARETDDTDGLTEFGMAIGTVTYAAPEQLLGRPLDGRADQYALAASAFHLLAGTPPFDHSNRAVVVGSHLNTPPPRLSERRADLAHLDDVLTKALAKDPADRYPSCSDFANALADPAAIPARDGSAPLPPTLNPVPEGQTGPDDTGVHTAAFAGFDDPGPSVPPSTKRLQVMAVQGTACAVQKRPPGPGQDEEIWEFRVERYESTGHPHTVVPVELRGTSITGQLSDGDVVEVRGIWDDGILLADSVVNHSARAHGRRTTKSVGATTDDTVDTPVPKPHKRRNVVVVAAMAVAAMLVAAMVVSGGPWSQRRSGPIVQPESASVFSPGGASDHPGQAGLAIDGDPDTAWPTDIYVDATPFPTFKQGVGLMLTLSEPTALSAVTIDVPSTGTEVQVRAADSASPSSLSDTTELTGSVPLRPGHNRIPIDNQTKTDNVLIWISTLGTTDGQSRTEISGITLEAAR